MSDPVTPQTVALQSPLSVALSRQEYWSGLPLPSPGDLPIPGIKPVSPAWQVDSLPLSHTKGDHKQCACRLPPTSQRSMPPGTHSLCNLPP